MTFTNGVNYKKNYFSNFPQWGKQQKKDFSLLFLIIIVLKSCSLKNRQPKFLAFRGRTC
jgi:hypothetical protein